MPQRSPGAISAKETHLKVVDVQVQHTEGSSTEGTVRVRYMCICTQISKGKRRRIHHQNRQERGASETHFNTEEIMQCHFPFEISDSVHFPLQRSEKYFTHGNLHELFSITKYVAISDRKMGIAEISTAACLTLAQPNSATTMTTLHYVCKV